MAGLMWEEEREKRRDEALKNHERLSRLFKEDRLSFERERRNAIKELIESAPNEEQKKRLWDLQNSWDKKMKGAGSAHNRMVLAKVIFWDHFHNVWNPEIQKFNKMLNDSE
ncbi:MAG: DUF3135 domain-containing protein [Desulfobacteraceae bacterium]|nr:MAG: DUF3135 domain-containing protein [Desulfobacteraceae bacterium]